jgi:hypothetical protein
VPSPFYNPSNWVGDPFFHFHGQGS